MLSILILLLIFGTTCLGLGWHLAARLDLPPPEKIVTAVFLSVLGVFLAGWLVYTADLPGAVLWCLPVLALAAFWFSRHSLLPVLRDSEVRRLLGWQLTIIVWCLGWLALIFSYSGGAWAADWVEHWERARFFVERTPLDFQFIGSYGFTARPPLVNAVAGAFLQLSRNDFPHYQVLMAVFSCLAFLPAVLLARRFGSSPGLVGRVGLLFMLSPMFLQNVTFVWTKLPTAFFVLIALWYFLHAWDRPPSKAIAALFAAALAAGILAHYSAGPYVVVLVAAWLLRAMMREGSWRGPTLVAAGVGGVLLAIWFGWAVANYGEETFLSNSTVLQSHTYQGSQLGKMALNIRDTIVPHFLRSPDFSLIEQTNPWGKWRDWWFQLYQVNLLFALGSTAWLVTLVTLWRDWRNAEASGRRFWLGFIGITVPLGIAVHGARDTMGLAHICLQPVVLLGLAYLAARWTGLNALWKRILVAGATLDLLLGIFLHYAVQNLALDRWFAAQRSMSSWFLGYSPPVLMNIRCKLYNDLQFFSDTLAMPPVAIFLLLGVLLAIAVTVVVRDSKMKA